MRTGRAGCLLTETSYLAAYPVFRRVVEHIRAG